MGAGDESCHRKVTLATRSAKTGHLLPGRYTQAANVSSSRHQVKQDRCSNSQSPDSSDKNRILIVRTG